MDRGRYNLSDRYVAAELSCERRHAVIGQATRHDSLEPCEVCVAVERHPVQGDPGLQAADTDAADLVVTTPNTGLNVGTPAHRHTDVCARPDRNLLQPTQVRRGVGPATEPEDRVHDQLPRSVERKRPAAIDPAHGPTASAHGSLVPEQLVLRRTSARREYRRMLHHDHRVGDLAGEPTTR